MASLSGFIRKHKMDIKILTIVSPQSFAWKTVHDKNSFGFKLLSKSDNFKKHLNALPDLETVAVVKEHQRSTLMELISNLNIYLLVDS